ncbi:MAG: hypothetical protein FWD71_08775 [Oscillospiraceae bacterium]|nr:hypothetical protein [Oscillospiraceae bacterium]
MNPFDIFIAYLSWGDSGKNRPVLAFIIDDNNVDVYQITTQYGNKSETIQAQYFKINDWAQSGLDRQSYVDTGTLITLSLSTFKNKKPAGKLTEADKQKLLEFLKS